MLYVNGDSMAWGQETHPDNTEEAIREHRFSYHVSKSLDMPEMNAAIPGSCNLRIARTSFLDIMEHKPKCAIILWSMPSRIEFTDYRADEYKWGSDALQLRDNSPKNPSLPKRLRSALAQYFTSLSSTYSDVANTFYYMANTKTLCDSLGIRCIQMWITDSCLRLVEECRESPREAYIKNFERYEKFLTSDPNIFSHSGETFASVSQYKYSNPPIDYHITAEGHLIAAEWFKDRLR